MGFLLEGRDVRLSLGGVEILNGISVGVHRGEFGVLLGPSGSGKSTLLKALSGILGVDRGEVLLDGKGLNSLPRDQVTRMIGEVPQDDIIHTGLKLRAALDYAARLRFPRGTSEDELQSAVDRVLQAIELTDRADVRIRKLSGGQRKRASMGVELLLAPPALLLDEPTSGLDPDLESTTMKLLRRLADEGRAVLTTTHAMGSLGLADFVIVLVKGWLAWYGPVEPALRHFNATDPELIFKRLRDAKPQEWASRYRQTAVAKQMRARPGPVRAS